MIRSKTYKIVLLLTTFVMAMVAAVCTMASVNANADDAVDTANKVDATASSYFEGAQELKFADNALVATVKDGDTVKIKNELMINDFAMNIEIGEGVEKVTLKLVTDSYLVNGKVVDGKIVKEVENTYEITTVGEIDLAISAKVGEVKVNGSALAQKVKEAGAVGAEVSFAFELAEGKETAEFKINSINQNTEKAGYEQTFEVVDNKLTAVLPRVALDDEVYSRGYANNPVFTVNKEKSLSFKVFSVFGDVKASDVYLGAEDGQGAVLDTSADKPKWIMFNTDGDKVIKLVDKDGKEFETINAKAVKYGTDDIAPEYVDNADALETFKLALEEAYTEDGHSLYLGATLNIPSLEDLVIDNTIPYSDLEKTVHYWTPKTNGTSSSMSFKLDKAGDYMFFVTFSDGANSMDEEDFIKLDGDTVEFINNALVFRFSIADDAPMSIKAPATEDATAYRGVTYTSASFKIDAEGFKTEYKLYFNSNKDAAAADEGWQEIPKASTVKEENYPDDYEAFKSINYDGKLTFKPIKLGAYKIVCSASSEYTTRTDEASTIIRVENEPKTVKIPSTWLQDNVWSVVFLSIGTLCLVGIIVLLCIKPKEENDAE